jgi:type II secretory pathway pseudopilin PulG
MKKNQRGVTLIELIVSLGLMAAVSVSLMSLMDQWASETKVSVAASHMLQFVDASKKYIEDNSATIGASATATTPVVITADQLRTANLLPPGFSSSNGFGQHVCALVLRPTADTLKAMIVTQGGTAIDDVSLGLMSGLLKGGGGAIYSTSSNAFTGVQGSYSFTFGAFGNATASGQDCSGASGSVSLTPGHPVYALWQSGADAASSFLYRNQVPGRDDLNTMNTPLIMASVAVADASCTKPRSISMDSSGLLLTCTTDLLWKPQGSTYWKDPVNNIYELNAIACTSAISGQTRVVNVPTVGSGPRAYTCNGTSWRALAVDDAGNLVVPGALTVGGDATAGGRMSGNTIRPNLVAAENASCSGYQTGDIASTSAGLTLSCQSGVWKKAAGGGNFYAHEGAAPCPIYYPGNWSSYTPTSAGNLSVPLAPWGGQPWGSSKPSGATFQYGGSQGCGDPQYTLMCVNGMSVIIGGYAATNCGDG